MDLDKYTPHYVPFGPVSDMDQIVKNLPAMQEA